MTLVQRIKNAGPPPRFVTLLVLIAVFLIIVIDWLSGPQVRLPLLFMLPVLFAAWFGRMRLTLAAALVLPATRAALELYIWQSDVPAIVLLNLAIRLFVMGLLASAGLLLGDQMRHLRQRLAATIDAAEDAIIGLRLDGTVEMWNAGAERMFGYRAEEILDQPAALLDAPGQPDDSQAIIRRVLHGERIALYETQCRRKDGSLLDLSLSTFPLRDGRGAVNGIAKIARNMTDRKRQEAQLRFLGDLQERLAAPLAAERILDVVGASIGSYLGVSQCLFVEINDAQDNIRIMHAWQRNQRSDPRGTYRRSDFATFDLSVMASSEQAAVVANIRNDRRFNSEPFDAIEVAAFIAMPFSRGNGWRYLMSVVSSEPRDWRDDEVDLVRAVTSRVFVWLERARAEQALRESEEKYRSLFNASDEGFAFCEMILDANGKPADLYVLDINPAVERLSGLLPEQVRGKTVREILPDIEPSWLETYARVALGGETLRFENLAKPLGRWFGVYATPIGQATRRFLIVFQDISERKQAEETLRLNEARQAFLLTLTDALRPMTNPLEVQETATRLLGEHLGADRALYADVVRDGDMLFYQIERGYHAPGFMSAPGRFPAHSFGTWMIDNQINHPLVVPDLETDTRWTEQERRHLRSNGLRSWISVPLFKDGRYVAVLVVASAHERHWTPNEVTLVEETAQRTWAAVERVYTENAVRTSEERYRTLVESIDEGFCVLTLITNDTGDIVDYRIVQANPAFERLTQVVNAVGHTASELALDLPPIWHDAFRHILATGESVRASRHFTQLNRWFETYAFRVGSVGSPQVAVLLTDITEHKRAEEEQRQLEAKLQHTQKLESLGVLAGGIAHDFNNLLTGILGYADLALLEVPPGSRAHELISETVKSTQRAAELTNQMLAYSGKGHFVIEPLDLSMLVRDMARLLEISISKNCTLTLELAPRLPTIEADATQIRQVVMNLVINASEAIGEQSGTIRVSTGSLFCDRAYLADAYLEADLAPGTYVFLEVSDNGEGMTEETRARIFEPFYTTKFTGRGLGLSAVMGIVRGHRGALKLATAPGAGSTFRVLFPSSDRALGTGDQRSHPAREWQGQGGVLVIDDEALVRGLIQKMLERMGFTVFAAADGPAGIAMLRANVNNIRLALLDMTMPHMNGAMTFQELRRIQPELPVILMSGYNEQTAASQFTEQGIAAFIQKPFRIPDLRGLVRQVLDEAEPAAP